ncbi:hypothetical protein AcW1_007571 [Taiwanofungus camphoratus]|nr:hypothetical protein AcW2_007373 [Antrodia cinnamomea]KAI0927075.1 hypothetical protein AcV5_007707 [Antrodia cinnamomea]KAI0947316.1 hypothetical protein AcV7_009772 [Antrodia cinnamomea]KAI0953323.1 hypothetical protein AcW1_007571 [Antrodia cinnamomea]
MPGIKLGDAQGIPILNFGPFLDGSAKQEVADAMFESFRDIGFVYLVNHGLPKEKIDTMFDWSKRFFAQPYATKMLAPHPPSGAHHRGYSAPGMEKVSHEVFDAEQLAKARAKAPDVKESFECGREGDSNMSNIWLPDGTLPGFKEACLDFFWACHKVEITILRALALGLQLSEDYLEKYHTAADNQLRLLHYPSVPITKLDNEEVARIGAHSDYITVTLLMQDSVGGLEVENPKKPGEFKGAPPIEGAIVVNAGDFLMRCRCPCLHNSMRILSMVLLHFEGSNDTIRSTIHRVRAPPNLITKDGMTPERYSIPYFCSAVSAISMSQSN